MFVLAGLGVLGSVLPQAANAQTGGVLPAGTLPVLRGVVSGQAVVNSPVRGAERPVLTVDQTSQRAIIDWRSFNIAKDSEVLFRQPGSTASALNRIYDANPSTIQGRLGSTGPLDANGKPTAGGQLILINQNGIMFDRGAQVNTQSLVASTLNLSNERFLSGVLTGGGLTTPAFEGGYDAAGTTLPTRPDGSRPGNIVIGNNGAADSPAASLRANAGGSILLFAPNIDNAGGLISAPDGQVMLAAGSKVYLALNDDANDITLRGFRVEVEAAPNGQALNLTHLIRNAGEISADRGNVSLAALAVNQEGRISAKTAVQSNGSIFLTARTKDAAQAGRVSFKAGSVTEVVPDAADTATMPDSQDYQPYRGVIAVNGRTIESSGALRAPGGRITLNAADSTDPTAARVYLDAGSETSVAGAWSDVDFKKNLQTFRVTSNELKNSPDQKAGVLRGATVTVDLRQGSNILELGGYRDIVARSVAEKAAVGGELQIGSSGSVIQRSGATIDASGGGYRYSSGTANTTRLLGDDGKIYDIATAPEQQQYSQLLDRYERTDARWGQTISMVNLLGSVGTFQPAYSEGLGGGLVTINSSAGLVLDGSLNGGVTIGPRQLNGAPLGATLRIGEYVSRLGSLTQSQRIGNTTWQQQASDTLGAGFNASTALTPAQIDAVTLAAAQVFGGSRETADGLRENGFGTVELNANGRIVVPANVRIASSVGGELILRAPQIDIGGDIRLPAGNLAIRPVLSPIDPISPELGTVAERVIVRSGADLSTAGAWLNNSNPDGSFVGAPAPSGRLLADGSGTKRAIDGGNITIQIDDVNHQTRLARGASLDVGGGASIASNQRVTGGRGGKLSIANGTANQTTSDWLQADLRGFAIGNGGELSLSLAQAVIDVDGANGVLPSGTTRLGAGLFSELGFSKISVVASDAIDIVAGTALKVQQKNLVVDSGLAAQLQTGADLTSVADLQLLPDSQRSAASIVLNAKGGGQPLTAVLTLNKDASISTDARGEVSLSAVNGLSIDGRISAPGGKIGVTLNGPADLTAPDLRVGSAASISAAGVFVRMPDDRGLVQGTLVNGGSVTLDAKQSGLRFAAGASIDVASVNQTVDVATTGTAPGLVRQTLEGHAGSVVLKSQGQTVLDGRLLGRGGSASAAGGSFALELRRPDGQPALPDERRIVVTSGRDRVPAQPGLVDATVNVDALTAGGFEKLRLLSENRIEFQGNSSLAFERGIRLDAPLIDLAGAAKVTLQGSTVALGQSLGERQLIAGDVPAWQLVDGTASSVLATRAGEGVLTVNGGAVDLYGSLTINGTSVARINSDSDIRLVGRPVSVAGQSGGISNTLQAGGLTTAGNLELVAAQVYPSTRTEYTFAVKNQPTNTATEGGYISVANNGNAAGSVYSAGGKLTLDAQTIAQGGTLKAPLGQIDLRAERLLEVAAGSLTSVSADNLTVPYGTTQAGVNWVYVDSNLTSVSRLVSVTDSGKRINLSAPTIDVRPGSTIDLRGGGDVLAAEFVPGNGGDKDITLRDNTFAIIPAARLAAMPFDSHTLSLKDPGFGFSVSNGRDGALYDSVAVGAGSSVPAGEYILLPARYALLPDAYLVELQTSPAYRNLQAGQASTLANGDVLVAGFRTARGTSVRESQSVGVVISPGSAVRQRSDYNLSGAAFFADAAALDRLAVPRAPWDAGHLSIENATALTLGGSFETAATMSPSKTAGRASEIDIAGSRIAVVDRVGDSSVPAGFLQIEGASLSNLSSSVLLGGTRSDTASGIRIATSASEVLVANSSAGAVSLPELMLTASNSIDIRSGSVLSGSGAAVGVSPGVISAESSGALVRLSNGSQTRLDRGTASTDSGDVRIAAGTTLSAQTSLLIDATRSTESRGTLLAGGLLGAGGSLSLSSAQVNLGSTDVANGALSGLVLSNHQLASFGALDEFVLRGYGAIDLIGTTALGSQNLGRLTLDTPLLRGRDTVNGQSSQASVAAREIQLVNSTAANTAAGTGTGTLTAQAERIVLGTGSKAVAGFAGARLVASDAVATDGKGSLQVAAALTLDAPRVLALGGSNQTVSAVDTSQTNAPVYSRLTLAGTSAATTTASKSTTELGGRLTLEGQSVDVGTKVQARSGQITVAARGAGSSDGVTLAAGALLDASGQAKSFNGTVALADGGSVSMTAAAGRVAVDAGAVVDVSAAPEGGGAGRLTVRGTALALAGELKGQAGAGARSGSAEIDVATLPSFSALNDVLNAGGFAAERQVRLRTGNLAVAGSDVVAAQRVSLAADSGRIDVAGTVGTGAAGGGARVDLHAGSGIALAAGSQIVAKGSHAGARGGEVRVATVSGALEFDSAATIDARAGDAGPAGSVIFGVGRDANNTMDATRLDGTVLRWSAAGLVARGAGVRGDAPASVDVEATRTYNVGTSVSGADIAAFAADHAAFVAGSNSNAVTGALRDETGALGGARLLGATEVRSTGNLSLAAAWDLTDSQWLAGGKPGTLTVRAAGNLALSQALGSPNDEILVGDTWNLRLAAGADLLGANPLTTLAADRLLADTGKLTLEGDSARLRTGTGRIDLAAARDVRIESIAATVYTAGRIGEPDAANLPALDGNAAVDYNRWGVDGGGISIVAGGEVSGAVSPKGDLWINEWLRRPRQSNNQFADLKPTDWWSHRPRFQQAVGTLAGGDIDIVAGGTLSNLAVMLPTTGRTYRDGDGVRQVDVQGGGNLNVRTAENVVGSAFLVARGAGRVEAAGDIGADRRTQLYVMGASSANVPEGASLKLVAGGAVALQSVNNPTAMFQANSDATDPASGPSFNTQGNVSTFFTYSANSQAGAYAKSGDLSYEAVLPLTWRTFNRTSPIRGGQTGFSGAFPASLALVAFDGSITGPPLTDAITTFPSTSATAVMLAGGSLFNAGFYGSDRDPATVTTPTTAFDRANVIARQLDGRTGLRPTGSQARIVSREVDGAYVFELQALEGSFVANASSSGVVFTAPGRLRAGVDIVGANLRLQNLRPDDLTDVRADTGDFRTPVGIEISGPGRLLLQAGRNVDLGSATFAQGTAGDIGGLVATGSTGNSQLLFDKSARVTVAAGVKGDLNLARMDGAYNEIIALNSASSDIIDFYRQLGTEPDAGVVLDSADVAALARRDPTYARFVSLDKTAPRALAAYQGSLRIGDLPLGPTADSSAAAALYGALNAEADVAKLRAAGSVKALADAPGGEAYRAYVGLDQRYPRVFADYLQRRGKGALPSGLTPIVFSDSLLGVVADVVPSGSVSSGNIFSYQTSIQTYGGSDIDLWAPSGNIVVGLTTPRADKTVGLLTNAGGAVRSVLSGDFNINQGKVITAQGGDILLFSTQGSIDAGRGAKTSLNTPPPTRTPIFETVDGVQVQVGVLLTIPSSATGSGIQTLSSDPDGVGPRNAPAAGSVYLFAPAGTIDAGEAGIRSGGNIVLNAQTVLNASNIASAGTSAGVPVATSGSLASSLASSSTTTAGSSNAAEEAGKAASTAARAAAVPIAKPTILTVEVLGFGDRNCKEQEKDCFAK